MIALVPVDCPYCGATVEHTVDLSGGALQRYVEDCEVCCRPWSLEVRVLEEGEPSVSASTLDD